MDADGTTDMTVRARNLTFRVIEGKAMTFTVHGIDGFLHLIAALCFLVAAICAGVSRGGRAVMVLLCAGLFCWVLTFLVR
jgi:hypothetical protein